MTSCHAILGRKTANIQMLLECRLSKWNASNQHQKGAKLHALQNVYLGFSKFLFLVPQKSKFWFFKNRCPKNQKIYRYPKNRNIYHRTTCYKNVYKISGQYLYFWLCNRQKTRKKRSRHFFWNALFTFLIVLHQNKSSFWKPERKWTRWVWI